MNGARRIEGLPTPRGHEYPPRHREVLAQALRLFAERGYAGASLRELARRLGIQQPSLYHYFRSKDELVEQVLDYFGVGGAATMIAHEEPHVPADIADLPAALSLFVRYLYDHTDWALFVRFMFLLAAENRSFTPRLREMFVERSNELTSILLRHYVESGQIDAEDAKHLSRMILAAHALPLIEERLLFPDDSRHPDLEPYFAFIVESARVVIEAKRKKT
ncbi:MAG: TetR/AcrR family transcriptional regulator [Sandaracinaceae bacterium]|nr:TetR/AcrR family transcriptional regulator [Sandaracinaceae bacterium]